VIYWQHHKRVIFNFLQIKKQFHNEMRMATRKDKIARDVMAMRNEGTVLPIASSFFLSFHYSVCRYSPTAIHQHFLSISLSFLLYYFLSPTLSLKMCYKYFLIRINSSDFQQARKFLRCPSLCHFNSHCPQQL
jgi:hypothetical protein